MITKNVATTRIFQAYDATTGDPATGLNLNNFEVQIAKDNGTFATASRAITETGYGYYCIALTSADTNTSLTLLRITHPDAEIEVVEIRPFETAAVGSAVLAAFYGDENGYDLIHQLTGHLRAAYKTSRPITVL